MVIGRDSVLSMYAPRLVNIYLDKRIINYWNFAHFAKQHV